MPDRKSEIQEIFEDMLSMFLEWDGVYKLDSIDRALLQSEANSLYRISKSIDRNLRSRFIVTAKDVELDIIGEGMNRPRLAGETDDAYKKRLIVNDTFFNDTTLRGLKNALRGYYGVDVDNDGLNDTKIIEVYKTALSGGSELTTDSKFVGENVREGAIEVHLMMRQDGDEVIIARTELFEKIFRTRAAGILLYLFWHGTFNDNLRKKLKDKTSLTGIFNELTIGDTERKVVSDDWSRGIPIIKRHDIIDIRTKGNIKSRDYQVLLATDNGAPKIEYKYEGASEENDGGKRFEDDISFGEMRSRRVHRLLNGEYFSLPKDFQTPIRAGQRKQICLYNQGQNQTREIMRIAPIGLKSIRAKIDEGTDTGFKVTLQVVPKEYNGYDLVYFGDEILTDYLMSGKWYSINEKKLIESGIVECHYDEVLDEYATDGYYISPPIHVENLTRFGMVKWVYNTGDTKVQIRTAEDEASLESMGNDENWGMEYTTSTGEFIQEPVEEFFQFKVSIHGTPYKSPTFRLGELFFEYWDIPTQAIEEVYDNVLNGQNLISAMSSSVIGIPLVMEPNIRGNGGSNPNLTFEKSYWITTIQPLRQPRIRNRRWTLFYGVKSIVTEYFSRDSIHLYEREAVCL